MRYLSFACTIKQLIPTETSGRMVSTKAAQERSEPYNKSHCPAGANIPATHMGTDGDGEHAVGQRSDTE